MNWRPVFYKGSHWIFYPKPVLIRVVFEVALGECFPPSLMLRSFFEGACV